VGNTHITINNHVTWEKSKGMKHTHTFGHQRSIPEMYFFKNTDIQCAVKEAVYQKLYKIDVVMLSLLTNNRT